MELSKEELLEKFPVLNKFKDQDWISAASITQKANLKELPLQAAFAMIKDTIEFIERTKFNSRWEEGFSVKIRLQQIESLLKHFCEETEVEKTLKGKDVNQLFPTHARPMP